MNEMIETMRCHGGRSTRDETSPGVGLHGKTVIITRACLPGDRLEAALLSRGAKVVHFPTVYQASSWVETDVVGAIRWLGAHAWIVFASANGLRYFAGALSALNLEIPPGVRLAAIGPGTARAITNQGWLVSFQAQKSTGHAMVAEFLAQSGDGEGPLSVLLPAAREGRVELEEGLRAGGVSVRRLVVYRTVPSARETLPDLAAERPDYVLFMSPSAVRAFDALGVWPPTARLAAIGPTTAAALKALSRSPEVVAPIHTIDGLVAAIERDGENRQS